MCGICGKYNYKSDQSVTKDEIETMCSYIKHRGPDDQGVYVKDSIGLGMRRLSIIDVAGGKQPITNEDRNIWVVFNGEIYNYKDLRNDLINNGHVFKTNSDTECIVHLYEEKGNDFVKYLRGMFSIAIWDDREKKLILARDRLGIKPLFYAQKGKSFYFASEMKSILQENKIPRDINDNALACYFKLSYIPAPMTIYENIRKILPGHIVTLKNGRVKEEKYWNLEFDADRSKSEDYFSEGFMDILQESIDIRLMSEVPLGAFLSGGIDSSTVVALMSKLCSEPVNTFTIGFGGDVGGYLDERQYAKMLAEKFETNHKEFEVLPNFQNLVETIVRAFDEPFADDSTIPSYFVYKMAKKNVTVALSGLGGDEVFGGYERYLGFAISRLYQKVPPWIREKIFKNIIETLPEKANGHYTINHLKRFARAGSFPSDKRYFEYVSISNNGLGYLAEPERFREPMNVCQDMVLSYFNATNANEDLNRVFYCDYNTYLPEDILSVTDRLSMHHSLEVRVPFLDHKLVEFCATIPPEMKIKWLKKKYLLKKATAPILPKKILKHRKQGFVGPMTYWLKNDLKPYVLDTLSEEKMAKHGFFNPKKVQRLLHEHFSGKEIYDTLIWALVIFQTWFEEYIDN